MNDLPVRTDGEVAILTVRVTPKSSKDAVETVEADAQGRSYVKVRVRAVPENGAANTAVCKLIAKWLGVRKSDVSVVSGDTARVKQLRVPSSEDELRVALQGLQS